MAIRKKRKEKGRRADPKGSNPHSQGDNFSASGEICGNQKEIVASTADNVMVIVMIVVIKFIIFPWILTKTG